MHSVLLSADRASPALRRAVERSWGCRVFDHYGTAEMGFGGAVECEARNGYHLREADLLFEVVDPLSGRAVSAGEPGEVVVTTLRRTGMPLVRYRTGDLSAFIAGRCRCGSALRRLAPIAGRLGAGVSLADGALLTLAELDECLLALPGVADFAAAVDADGRGYERLEIRLRVMGAEPPGADADGLAPATRVALAAAPALAAAVAGGRLVIDVTVDDGSWWPVSNGMVKRTLIDEREAAHA